MADGKIAFEFVVQGEEKAARDVGDLKDKLSQAGTAAEQFAGKARAAATGATTVGNASKNAGRDMGSMVNVVAEFGYSMGTAIPGMQRFGTQIAMMGGSAYQLGAAFGPAGVAIGVVSGLMPTLISAFSSASGGADTFAESMRVMRGDVDLSTESIRDLISQMRELENRQRQIAGLASVGDIAGSQQEQELARRGLLRQQAPLEADFMTRAGLSEAPTTAAIREFLSDPNRGSSESREAARALLAVRDRLDAIDVELNLLGQGRSIATESEALSARGQAGFDALTGNTPEAARLRRQRDARAASAREAQAAARRGAAASRAGDRDADTVDAESLAAAQGRILDALASGGVSDESLDKLREAFRLGSSLGELGNRATADQMELNEARAAGDAAQKAADDAESARVQELADLRKRKLREVGEAEEREREKAKAATEALYEDVKSKAQEVLGPVLSGLTNALSHVIAGSKSADEAFAGMLASFLEMIAQRAALEAAANFAAAIADAASQQWGAFPLHLAAGAAWTGVAVAAGAASIAVAPSVGAAPASPERSPSQQQGSGGQQTIVVNWNGGVITAGTHAELGRELRRAIGEADERWGRSAA